MDESFSYFYHDNGFGPAIETRPVSSSSVEKFRGRLPNRLLQYWLDQGWSGYGRGLFWLVDPDEYEPALEAWIGDLGIRAQDDYHVVARSAFGEMFIWGKQSGQSLKILSLWGMMFPTDDSAAISQGKEDFLVRMLFQLRKKVNLDQKDSMEKPLFERALKELGPLTAEEMYGFEPALALGGKADLKHLRKVKAVEHLVMLAQLGERSLMRDIVNETKKEGSV